MNDWVPGHPPADFVASERKPDAIITPADTRGDVFITADVVVVGSGAGGATVAATLAEAGLRVVVLEEGDWFPTREYSAHVPPC
ncbi:MAG: FAD-binding protein [bacterium]